MQFNRFFGGVHVEKKHFARSKGLGPEERASADPAVDAGPVELATFSGQPRRGTQRNLLSKRALALFDSFSAGAIASALCCYMLLT